MKKTIMLIIISLALGLFLFSSPPAQAGKTIDNTQSSVIGQWINESNDLLEFTPNKQVFLNGQKYGRFSFITDAAPTVIVELNSTTAKNNRKYFEMKLDDKNQWVLIDVTVENQFEEKTFIRLNPVREKTKQ